MAADICRQCGRVYHCTQTVLPDMIRRREGKIVNISSMWGQVRRLLRSLLFGGKGRRDRDDKGAGKGVGLRASRLTAWLPRVIATEMNAHLSGGGYAGFGRGNAAGAAGHAGGCFRALLFLASEDADFITGQVLGSQRRICDLNIYGKAAHFSFRQDGLCFSEKIFPFS